jgi:hypothetical protein
MCTLSRDAAVPALQTTTAVVHVRVRVHTVGYLFCLLKDLSSGSTCKFLAHFASCTPGSHAGRLRGRNLWDSWSSSTHPPPQQRIGVHLAPAWQRARPNPKLARPLSLQGPPPLQRCVPSSTSTSTSNIAITSSSSIPTCLPAGVPLLSVPTTTLLSCSHRSPSFDNHRRRSWGSAFAYSCVHLQSFQ